MPEVSFLVLMLTERCNLNCSYCYACAGQSNREMSPDVAWQAIETLAPGQGKLTVEMAGGEPLLNWPLVEELAWNHDPEKVNLAIQTNGLLLDRERLAFLIEHKVGLGVSLDGPPQVNDRLRGGGTKVLDAIDLIGDAGVGVNITTVITRHNLANLPEFLLLLAQKPAVRVVNLDLVRVLGRARRELEPTAKLIHETIPHMLNTLAFINERRWPPLKVREVEQTLRRAGDAGLKPYCLAGLGGYAAVKPGGEIYCCSSLCGQTGFQAGTTAEPSLKDLTSLARAVNLPQACTDYAALPACRGGCPARRWASGVASGTNQIECALRMALWERLAV